MKKIFSILLSLLMIFTSFTALAEDSDEDYVPTKKYGDEIKFFADAGVFDVEFYDDDAITRKEYAVILVRLLNAEGSLPATASGNAFSDIKADTADGEYVEFLKDYGIFKGNSDSTFRPDDDLTLSDAITCIVRLLGYTTKADYTGGYASGYRRAAVDLGLLRGVDTDMCEDYMAAGPLAKMLYNSLDKEIMNSYYINGTNVSINGTQGMTLLQLLGYEKGTGTVNAIENINLYGAVDEKLEGSIVEINQKKFRTYDSKVKKLLGYQTEFYYKEEEGAKYPSLVSASIKNANAKEMTLYTDDIEKVSSTTVTYKDKNKDKEITLKLSSPIILDNGTPVSQMSNDVSPKNGFMRLISNDGSSYDTVLIYDFETFQIKSIREETISFKYNAKTSWENKSSFDMSEIPYSVYTEEDGFNDIEALSKDMVVMIAYGKSGAYIYPCSESIMGEITSTTVEDGKDKYYVNGEYYSVNPDFQKLIDAKTDGTKPFELNMYTKYYLDFLGRIYGMQEVGSEFEYGYVFGISQTGSIDKIVEVKVLCDSMSGVGIFGVSDKVTLNGVKSSPEDIYTAFEAMKKDTSKSPVFKFKFNSDKKLTDVVTTTVTGNVPDKIGDDCIVLSSEKRSRIWEFTSKYFTDYNSDLGYVYASTSLTFKIDTSKDEEKYYTVGECKKLMPNTDSTSYKAEFYDLDEWGVPGLVIYHADMGGSNVKYNSDIYFVKSTYYGLNEKGDSALGIVTVDKNGTEKKFLTDGETETTTVCKSLAKGDIVQLSTNAQNIVEGVEKVFSYNITKSELDTNFNNASTGYYVKRMKENGNAGQFTIYSKIKSLGTSPSGSVIRFDEMMPTSALPSDRAPHDYKAVSTNKFLAYDGKDVYSMTADDLEVGDVFFAIGAVGGIKYMFVAKNAEYHGQHYVYRAS